MGGGSLSMAELIVKSVSAIYAWHTRWAMSALGHKQTYAPQKGMSALPPIATEKADMREWSCLLYPQERTCAAQPAMSAMGQKRTSPSLDHFIGARDQRWRHS